MTASKNLTMNIEITKMTSQHRPELEYSINGEVSEQGHYFGFGFPLRAEEFNQENITQIIQAQCQPTTWGITENTKIKPKIITDCREKQMTLGEFQQKLDTSKSTLGW